MGFGDKKEAWEASVNMTQDELGTVRPGTQHADRDDVLQAFCKANLARDDDFKNELTILKDGPITLLRNGQRYDRWLYYKAWGPSPSHSIRGYYIYDNGTDTPDVG